MFIRPEINMHLCNKKKLHSEYSDDWQIFYLYFCFSSLILVDGHFIRIPSEKISYSQWLMKVLTRWPTMKWKKSCFQVEGSSREQTRLVGSRQTAMRCKKVLVHLPESWHTGELILTMKYGLLAFERFASIARFDVCKMGIRQSRNNLGAPEWWIFFIHLSRCKIHKNKINWLSNKWQTLRNLYGVWRLKIISQKYLLNTIVHHETPFSWNMNDFICVANCSSDFAIVSLPSFEKKVFAHYYDRIIGSIQFSHIRHATAVQGAW